VTKTLTVTRAATAPGFYAAFAGMLLVAVGVVCLPATGVGTSPVLSVQVEIVNALLMPFVLCFVWLLSANTRVMPEQFRLRGWFKWLLGAVFTAASAFCFYATALDLMALL
jgi:hypothetical protein